MGLRSGEGGIAAGRYYRLRPGAPAEPIDERDVPEEARAALARMVGQCETIEMLVDFGAPGVVEALARLCDEAEEHE